MLVNAGIVDDDIVWSVPRHYSLHHAGVADIEARRGRSDLPGKVGCSSEIADHDVRTSLRKTSYDRRTDALRATRDEGAAAIEPPERPGAGRGH
jgi:hypothetical protein